MSRSSTCGAAPSSGPDRPARPFHVPVGHGGLSRTGHDGPVRYHSLRTDGEPDAGLANPSPRRSRSARCSTSARHPGPRGTSDRDPAEPGRRARTSSPRGPRVDRGAAHRADLLREIVDVAHQHALPVVGQIWRMDGRRRRRPGSPLDNSSRSLRADVSGEASSTMDWYRNAWRSRHGSGPPSTGRTRSG
jgi:hypothetical protein